MPNAVDCTCAAQPKGTTCAGVSPKPTGLTAVEDLWCCNTPEP
jgi:hypothetical protein